MTSDGSRYGAANRRLERALADGDLGRAVTASRELPRVGLQDAAKILFLMARNRDRRYPKAAARWLSRFAAEAADVTPEQLAQVADALADLEHADPEAAEVLFSRGRRRAEVSVAECRARAQAPQPCARQTDQLAVAPPPETRSPPPARPRAGARAELGAVRVGDRLDDREPEPVPLLWRVRAPPSRWKGWKRRSISPAGRPGRCSRSTRTRAGRGSRW